MAKNGIFGHFGPSIGKKAKKWHFWPKTLKNPFWTLQNPIFTPLKNPPFLPFLPGLENVPGPLFIFKPPPPTGFLGVKNFAPGGIV